MEIEKEMQYSRICPVCRSVIRKKIYTSYEVTAPSEQFKTINDLKERFSAVCPKCGYSIPLGFPFRYVDRLQHFDLFLVPNGYPSENEILNSLSEFDVNSGYITRLVSDDLELFDKIRIFSAGLDDRVVELCKVTVLGDYCESNPKYAQLPLLRAQYFKHEKDNTEYSGANILMYTLQNGEKKETIALALSLDYYLNIQRHCQIDIDAQPTGCFDVINLNWANRLCDYRKEDLVSKVPLSREYLWIIHHIERLLMLIVNFLICKNNVFSLEENTKLYVSEMLCGKYAIIQSIITPLY